ncbi:MAG: DUF4428 domain-containing protein [Lachnospiraceae bacterium]|nr:DUF4428 domain-containing protein [Lachnospiraceae bacterium]
MGLFDKKYCDICGSKIGLLGNKKLEDGNMCKDCQRLLSPWFSDRRHSTVEEIKGQLAYREANQAKVTAFTPTKTFGNQTKLVLDEGKGQFIVTRSDNWIKENPDVVDLSALTGYEAAVKVDQDEEKTRNAEGKMVSYDPPQYTYEYDFKVRLLVNHPYFDDMAFEPFRSVKEKSVVVNGQPAAVHQAEFKEIKAEFDELRAALDKFCACVSYSEPKEEEAPAPAAAPAAAATAAAGPNTFVFPSLPKSVSELLTLPGVSFHDPFAVAAMAVAAFCRFPEDRDTCFAMIDALKGPQPLSNVDKSFIKDRFMDGKGYIPRSYFDGATPENDYTPNQPYTIRVIESAHSRDQFDQGYITLYLKSGGADSERPVTLRHKPSTDEWFLWNHTGILAGIRVPKSSDPWA